MHDPVRHVVELHPQKASSYHLRLSLREAWRAWRHGLSLPAGRLNAEYGFTVGGGGGGEYTKGEWTIPHGVTSVEIEVIRGGQDA